MVTVIEPLVPEPDPTALPEQATDAEVASEVFQLKVVELPEVTVVFAKDADTPAVATADNATLLCTAYPVLLAAVTVQYPVPGPVVPTEIVPLVPEPEPEATPEQ